MVVPRIEDFTTAFFSHLSTLEEARTLLSNRELVDRARNLKREHLAAMVSGEYGVFRWMTTV